VLLLNSDTEVSENAIQSMLLFLKKHPKAGVATCRLELTDGGIDPASHRGFPDPWAAFTYIVGLESLFPKSRLFSRYHMGFRDMTRAHEIDCPSGAFFLIKRSVIYKVGLLDDDFFIY
jgi:GT2 family glycosyltransferase